MVRPRLGLGQPVLSAPSARRRRRVTRRVIHRSGPVDEVVLALQPSPLRACSDGHTTFTRRGTVSMFSRARSIFTPSMAIAMLALIVSLSSASVAALVITGKQIQNSTITSADVKNGTLKLKDFAASTKTGLKGADRRDGRTGATGGTGGADRGRRAPASEPAGAGVDGRVAVRQGASRARLATTPSPPPRRGAWSSTRRSLSPPSLPPRSSSANSQDRRLCRSPTDDDATVHRHVRRSDGTCWRRCVRYFTDRSSNAWHRRVSPRWRPVTDPGLSSCAWLLRGPAPATSTSRRAYPAP